MGSATNTSVSPSPDVILPHQVTVTERGDVVAPLGEAAVLASLTLSRRLWLFSTTLVCVGLLLVVGTVLLLRERRLQESESLRNERNMSIESENESLRSDNESLRLENERLRAELRKRGVDIPPMFVRRPPTQ